jgi:hypothetical protein
LYADWNFSNLDVFREKDKGMEERREEGSFFSGADDYFDSQRICKGQAKFDVPKEGDRG